MVRDGAGAPTHHEGHETRLRDLATRPARGLTLVHSQREGAGNAGCTLHPRSRVQWVDGSAHEHTGSAEALRHSLRNGFTAYFVLFPATNSFCHRHQRIESCLSPVGPTRLRWLDISHGCQNHTTSPYAATSRQNADRQRADHRIQPRVRDDRDTPLLPGWMAEMIAVICPTALAECFLGWGWTGRIRLIWFGKLR